MYKHKQIWVPKRDFRKAAFLKATNQANEKNVAIEESSSKNISSEAHTSTTTFVETQRRKKASRSKRRNLLRKEVVEFAKEDWEDYLNSLDMSDEPREYLRIDPNV